MSKATGVSFGNSDEKLLKNRDPKKVPSQPTVYDSDEKKPKYQILPTVLEKTAKSLNAIEPYLAPLIYTALALFVRISGINASHKVVWDEAHFGKFGSYYIKHEFYHDVHPPLGKMLIGLSEWLANFDGDFDFASGSIYPSKVNFTYMRIFNALFSVAVTPVAYFAAKSLGLRVITVHLITLMITLESTYIALGKFILLDSILLFFTATTFLSFVQTHRLKEEKKEFSTGWYIWFLLTGISIGCVCSTKWVGLFVTALVGLYTLHELVEKFFQEDFKWDKYAKHWVVRVLNLIVIPFLIYLLSFKAHFALLYKSGTGDASTSSLFQVNLEGNKILSSPRDVLYGSEITIRSQGLSPNLLHSHVQIYPEGSNQQQITGYGHSDGNNDWIVKYSRRSGLKLNDPSSEHGPVKDGDIIRLSHKFTNVNLHSHEIQAHVSRNHREVAGYGSEQIGDSKDDWVVEIVEQVASQNKTYPKEDNTIIHPLSTSFRLRHADLGCYLATTGMSYPAWGFKQSEVVCKESWSHRDKATWWNVEDHSNEALSADENYIPPKSNFWSDFILINFAMASSNNALVPDDDKFDALASKWWEWPTLYVGLRMCGWGSNDLKYFLIGNVFNTWGSSLAILGFSILILVNFYKYQRQTLSWNRDDLWKFLISGVYPLIGWAFHFLPFVIMGRVTYVHHYVPALFFAIFVYGYFIEILLGNQRWYIRYPAFILNFVLLIYTFSKYAPFHQGMSGDAINFNKLKLLPSWKVFD
ncbi:hypothetical protein WICMUC_002358 [Wickerhamomyces mucosus]|uniref:Dolichyl-phosphate-mannose--protein mannosyltransferase n=1 Tax=Wickerhamomyces mucosus TaxID=1378264 RepID=A0A9P8PPY5_9ASCO|nr:hypothetical protein WICMUC_002358 [Wickerhamomyces mucosus]